MSTVKRKKKTNGDTRQSEQLRNWLNKSKKHKMVFSQLVENLPDIAFQIQVEGSAKPNGTLDECAEWFYNEFYKNSAIREKYEIKVRSCPLAIKNKLLQLPIAEEATTTATGTATEIGVDVAIKNGRFQFPVSFATFKQYINKQRLINDLLRKKTDQERQLVLGDSKKLGDLLRKGYNVFYMFPHRRRLNKYEFKEASPEILQLLLKPGVPLDEAAAKTVSESPSSKSRKNKARAIQLQESLTSIVSFDVFEKFIKNIYEIVWQLKLNDLKDEGFDNCAKAYYIAFYLTPEIRERIQYEFVPCTSSMRNRLLALPSEADRAILLEMQKISLEIATSQELELNVISPPVEQLQVVDTPEVSYEVQVTYNKDAAESNAIPKDAYPVTFKLFKRYIKNLDGIVSEMLSSDEYKGKTKDECALEYFKAFYTTSQIRTKFKPELKACPSKIRAKLLALPAEEEVIVDVVDIDNDVPNEGNPPKVLTVAQDKDNVVDLPSEGNLVKIKGINYTYPVDIKTFLRYINYDELKKQLVDAHAKTKKIGDEANEKQLFKRFYYSFYLDKSLRKQFNYNFNAAPAHQRSKFTEMAVAITEKHGEELPQQVANTEPFYTTSQIRNKFKPELEACPSKISAKLLALPAEEEVIIDIVDIDNDVPNEGNPSKVLSVAKDKDNVVDLPSEGNLVKIKGINYTYPVDIKTFLRYVNYDELKKQLVEAHAKTKKIGDETNEKQLFKRFYYSFYLDKSLRKQFNYNFNAAPAHQRSKFTEMAVAIPEKRGELPQQVANTEPSTSTHISAQEQPILEPSNCKSNEITCSDCELDVIVDIGKSGRFIFPVSFETFKRCINYDELLHPLLLHVTQQCNEEARMIAKSDPMRCRNVFTRYYRSFYVRPIVRKQYAYRFESVSASLKSQLMQYAVPLNARARKEMNIAATTGAPKACAAVIEEGTTETEVDMEIDEIVEITEINEPNVASFGNGIAIGRKTNSVVAPSEASNASGKIANTQITEEVIILNSEETDVSLQRTPLMVEASTTVEKTSNASGILRNKAMIDAENTHTFAIGEKAASPRMTVAITEKREEELPQQVANTEPSTSTQICEQKQPILECSDCELYVMEEITNLGRFIFPVSFETFKRCINYDELLHPLLLHVTQQRHEEARFIAETDPKRCHNVFKQFYRSFYVRPIVRRQYAYRFESVSAELESKLMKYPVPLDETARITMNMATVKDVATTDAASAAVVEEITPDEVIILSSEDTDVSFQNTPLMVETSATVEKTSNASGILTNKPMIGSENTHTFAVGEKAASTSSEKANDDFIAENTSELNTKKMHTSSIPGCEVEKVKNTPITGTDKSDMVKVTAIAGVEITHESAIVENTATGVVTTIKENMALSGIEKKKPHQEYEGSPSTTLPVSFKLFKKYIQNLDAIVQQMLKCDDHADKSEDECAFQYFTAFYLEPAVREKYEFQIKPCPAKLREKILSIPVIEHESEHGAELQLGVEAEPERNESPAELLNINCNSQQSNDSEPLVVSQRIIITLKNMVYEFPVALQTFKQFINYESLKLELVKTYIKDKPKSNVESILNDERINSSLFRRFYHSFYIDPRVRKFFKYNFNAAPVEFRPKLLEYAVPLVRATRPITTEKVATVEVAQKESELQLAVNSTQDFNDSSENNAAFAQVSAQEQRCLSVDLETIAKRKDTEVPTSQGAAQSLNMDSMPAKRACIVPQLNVSAVCSTGISPPSTQCSIMSTPETSEQSASSAAVASSLEKDSPLCSLESMAPLVQSSSSDKSKTSDAEASEVLQQQLESHLQSPDALSATSEIEDQSSNESTVIYNDKADRSIADHTYNRSWSSECESLEDIYADRSDELEILEKLNVIEYIPHNLTYYIAHQTMNLRTRALLEKDFIIDRRPKQKAEELAANAKRSATNPQTIAKSYTTGNKTIPMVEIFPSSISNTKTFLATTAVAAPLKSASVPATVTLRKANKQTIANIKAEAEDSTEIAEAADNNESNLVDVKEDIVDIKEDIDDVDCSTANVANQHQNTISAPEILEKVGTKKFAGRRTEKVTRKVSRSIATVVDNSTEITKGPRTNAGESNKDKVSGIVTATNVKIGSTVVATNETSSRESTTTTATAGTSEVVVKNESSSNSVPETLPSTTAITKEVVVASESSSKSVTETIPSSTAATSKIVAGNESSSKNVTETLPSSTVATKTIPSSTAAISEVVDTNESSSKSVTETIPSSTAATSEVVASNESSSKSVPKTIPGSTATISEVVVKNESSSNSVPETLPSTTAITKEVVDTNESSSKSVTEAIPSSTAATSKIVAGNESSSKSVTETLPSSTAATSEVVATKESSSKSVPKTISSSIATTSKVVSGKELSSKIAPETIPSSTAATSEVVATNESSSKSVPKTIPSSTAAISEGVAGNESSSKSVTETLPSSTAATSEVVATKESSSKSVPKTISSSIATTSKVVSGKELSSKIAPETIPSSTAATSEVVATNESSSKSVPKTIPSSTATSSKVEVNKASYTSATKALETVSEATKATAPQAIASTDGARDTTKTASAAVVSESSSSQLKESNRAVAKPTEETTVAPTTFNLNSIDFFAPIGKEHNLKYLIYTSHGLKQTVWCILSQLTCSEFKKYTCIHNGESFYKDESLFSRVYSHVIHKGNWPINLYVKLPMLIELLRSKDVQIDELDLAHFSPKVLHSSELMRYTNFDDIAERNYRNRTGDRVNNLVDLFSEVENFYVECWMQDQWIQQVPRVTSQELKLANAKIEPVAFNIPECRIPICLLEKVPEAVIEIESETIELYDNSPQDILQDSDCPATQLEQSIAGNSLFVDVEDVDPATQLPETQSDPLMETSIEMPTVQIKQESVKLLSNMRFTIDSSQSQEVVCESISPEEQIINLDEDDERIAAELSCFAIVPPKDRSPPMSFLNANLSKCEFNDLMKDVSLSPELQLQITNQLMSLETSQIEVATSPTEESQVPVADVPPAATATAVAAPASPVRSVTIRKPSRAFKSTLPCKRPRLMANNVPQLRHDFRPLPFTAAVPNQATVNPSAQQELPTTSSSQVQSQSQQDSSDPPMTASQELATDNTLMASSQLQHLLDAPHVNVRQRRH
ncbi:protein telomere ends associated-like isoform X2 [Drosophila nasuta]|uniref:protein telomere ends associated-like isoform X2 n=1 Tax=Drosophila nasuta TaxID=42062 RepID=UPI00295ED1CE|nr:protein telomere ends associated-like isoform X2 [Drosophila nasuta]